MYTKVLNSASPATKLPTPRDRAGTDPQTATVQGKRPYEASPEHPRGGGMVPGPQNLQEALSRTPELRMLGGAQRLKKTDTAQSASAPTVPQLTRSKLATMLDRVSLSRGK